MSDDHTVLSPANAVLSESAGGMLCIRVDGGDEQAGVIIRQMFPVTRPSQFLSVRDKEDKELGVIEELGAFPKETRALALQHAQRRYFVPRIQVIHALKDEHGFFRWDTTTDRGRREFYVKGRTDTIRVLDGYRIFVTDVEECRYEIPDCRALPKPSQVLLEKVV